MSAGNGLFVWFDLITSDTTAAKAFYEAIAGWRMTRSPAGDFEMWKAADTEVGGLVALAPESLAAGMAPYWLGYVTVASVDATVARVDALGGKVLLPGRDIPNGGRFAVLADPLGALVAIHRPPTAQAAPDPQLPGHFGWSELQSSDWRLTWPFYSALFDWTISAELGDRALFAALKDTPIGELSNAARTLGLGAPPRWLHAIRVPEIGQAARTVVELGGQVLTGPAAAPPGGSIVRCQDPQGAHFALISLEAR